MPLIRPLVSRSDSTGWFPFGLATSKNVKASFSRFRPIASNFSAQSRSDQSAGDNWRSSLSEVNLQALTARHGLASDSGGRPALTPGGGGGTFWQRK
jgi:hypothetical protein